MPLSIVSEPSQVLLCQRSPDSSGLLSVGEKSGGALGSCAPEKSHWQSSLSNNSLIDRDETHSVYRRIGSSILSRTVWTFVDLRLLISAFLRPTINLVIGVATFAVNYFGARIIFLHFGYDLDNLVTNALFLFFIAAVLLAFSLRKPALDGLIDLLDRVVGANFALGLVMMPYLSYLFWPTMGWRFLAFWFIGLLWLAIDMFVAVNA